MRLSSHPCIPPVIHHRSNRLHSTSHPSTWPCIRSAVPHPLCSPYSQPAIHPFSYSVSYQSIHLSNHQFIQPFNKSVIKISSSSIHALINSAIHHTVINHAIHTSIQSSFDPAISQAIHPISRLAIRLDIHPYFHACNQPSIHLSCLQYVHPFTQLSPQPANDHPSVQPNFLLKMIKC